MANPLEESVEVFPGKFQNLKICSDGSERAHQPFRGWSELWIFTGTRCNLACAGCYTESTPRNDSFRFITLRQVETFLAEAGDAGIPRVCFTGGEPFYNPEFPAILDATLEAGFSCLVLTNLTRPFEVRGLRGVLDQIRRGRPLQIRASIDHPDPDVHEDRELRPETARRYPVPAPWRRVRDRWFRVGFHRGKGNFRRTLRNLATLHAAGGRVSVAGRGPAGVAGEMFRAYLRETEPRFRALFRRTGLPADLALKIFPDIGWGTDLEVPEVTQRRCRTLIPPEVFDGLMCNGIRMVAVPSIWEGRENHRTRVFPCTIVPDNPLMCLGGSLAEAASRETYLADSRCYRFCIAGGASCSET